MNRKKIHPLVFVAAAVALFATGAPLHATESDKTIESSFRTTFVYTTYLKDDAIKVDAFDGVVTLTGTVAEETHKELAQETVARLPGVTRVDNRLTTKTEAAPETDARIGRRVKLALQFHRSVNASQTAVEVRDGIVTLKGEASSMAQRDLTAEYAKDIEGVKGVRNEMTVATILEPVAQTTGGTLDDASITAQIVTALMTHRSTSSVITRVTTRNGEVTLTGITKNDAQNALIVKLVTDIQGVTSVKNQMTIENEPR